MGIPPIPPTALSSTTISNAGGALKAQMAAQRRANMGVADRGCLIRAPLWSAGATVVAKDKVRLASGELLICVTGGTTGASEPAFSVGTLITDNTAGWWALSERSRLNVDGYPAPTITTSTSITGLTARPWFSNQASWSAMTAPNLINGAGGNSTQRWAFNSGGPGDDQGMGTGRRGYLTTTEITSDAPKIAFGAWNSAGVQISIYVDGYLLEENPTRFIAGNPSYYIIDWSSAGGRLERTYRIESFGVINLTGVAVDGQSTVNVSPTSGVKGIWLSDSFGGTVSSYSSDPWDYLSETVMRSLGIQWTRNFHIGSTGYLNPGSGPYYTARQVLQNNPQTNWDAQLVVIGYQFNDVGLYTDQAVAAEALLTWQLARQQYPNAYILVLGGWPNRKAASSANISMDAAVAAQMTAWGDRNAGYLSFLNDPSGSPITGTGYTGATTGSGNSDFYTGADGVHPTWSGVAMLRNFILPRANSMMTLAGF